MARVTVTERWHRWDGMRYRVWARPVPGSAMPPLVLVHGYAACVEQWGRFIRDIGPDVPLYAVDLIGFGASSKPRHAPYGRAFYLAQLEHLRAEYGLERVVPVGHSLGGMLGIEWAAERPEAVASVVAIAPGGLLSGDEFTAWQNTLDSAYFDAGCHASAFFLRHPSALSHPLRARLRGSRGDGAVHTGGAQARDAIAGRGLVIFRACPPSRRLPRRRAPGRHRLPTAYSLGHEGRAGLPRGDSRHSPVNSLMLH